MGLALRLYEQLTETTDERVRLRLIADAIGELEEAGRARAKIARSGDVRESELRLQKEIEVVRKEIKEVELNLQKEIELVRKEIKEVELNLGKEIELVRKEIKEVELNLGKEIKEVELNLSKESREAELRMRKAMHQQTLWMIGAVGTVVGLVRLLDWLLATGNCPAHGDLELRLEGATRQIQAQPANLRWYLRRADLHREHSDWAAAEQDIATAQALDPSDPAPLYHRALLLRDRGEPMSAVQLLRRLLDPQQAASAPLQAKAHAELGKIVAEFGDWRDAAHQFSLAIARAEAPTPELYLARADALANAGHPGWAEAALRGLDEGIARLGAGTILPDRAIDIALRAGDVDAALARIDKRLQTPGYRLAAMVRKAEVMETARRPSAAALAYADAKRELHALPAKVRSTYGMRALAARIDAGRLHLLGASAADP
jgi:hypothetical protein